MHPVFWLYIVSFKFLKILEGRAKKTFASTQNYSADPHNLITVISHKNIGVSFLFLSF
jgi:hypothetical protein